MSIQKINIGGADVEIEDVSARNLINTLDDRVTTLENSPGGGGSEWVELTTINGQVAEITQKFSEIRMACICDTGVNYSVAYNFDNSRIIFFYHISIILIWINYKNISLCIFKSTI